MESASSSQRSHCSTPTRSTWTPFLSSLSKHHLGAWALHHARSVSTVSYCLCADYNSARPPLKGPDVRPGRAPSGPWGAVSDEAEEAKDQKDDHDRDDYPDNSSGASHF